MKSHDIFNKALEEFIEFIQFEMKNLYSLLGKKEPSSSEYWEISADDLKTDDTDLGIAVRMPYDDYADEDDRIQWVVRVEMDAVGNIYVHGENGDIIHICNLNLDDIFKVAYALEYIFGGIKNGTIVGSKKENN